MLKINYTDKKIYLCDEKIHIFDVFIQIIISLCSNLKNKHHMRKELFYNILKRGMCAISDEFSPEDKRIIYEVMFEKGMSNGSAYNRFFRDGFDKWELKGIRRIIDQFAYENQIDFNSHETFYKNLANKSPFKLRMKEYGMGNTTVICRFSGFNFKPWELDGIESIILKDLVDA